VALGRAEDDRCEEAAGGIRLLLDDGDPGVRLEALAAASKLGSPSLKGRVIEFLDSGSAVERTAALDFLSRHGREDDRAPVERLLAAEEETDVRCMALETLSYVDPPACLALVQEQLREPDGLETSYLRTLVMVLSELGDPEGLRELRRLFEHPSMGVRVDAAHVLAVSGPPEGDSRIAAVLLDALDRVRDRELRERALEGLCASRSEEVVEKARERFGRLFTPKAEKIFWAAACCSAGDEKAEKYLLRVFGGRSIPMAARVLRAVGLCGIEKWIPLLERNIQRGAGSGDAYFLYDSVSALGRMGSRKALETLERFEGVFEEDRPDVAEFIRGELEAAARPAQEGAG
jgi:hypothetical protein